MVVCLGAVIYLIVTLLATSITPLTFINPQDIHITMPATALLDGIVVLLPGSFCSEDSAPEPKDPGLLILLPSCRLCVS